MTADICKLIIGAVVPIISGYLILEIILFRRMMLGFLEKLALAYGTGIGMLTLLMFYLSLLKVRFTFSNITLSLILTVVLFISFFAKRGKPRGFLAQKQSICLSFVDKLLIVVIALVSLYVLFQALVTPLVDWDSWAIYGFKAKVFYLEKKVPLDFFKDATKSYSHFDYPLLVPLAEAWIHICLNNWNDQLAKIIFPLYFISLILIFYYGLKYFSNRRPALFFTSFLVTIPQLFYMGSSGYADLPLLFYYFTSVIFLFRAYHNDLDGDLLTISSIFAGFSAWTKNEGWAVSLFNILILLLIMLIQGRLNRRNLIILIRYALVVLFIAAPWFWFKNSLGLRNEVINNNLNMADIPGNLKRFPVILAWMGRNMILLKSWNLLWLFSAIIMIANFRKIITPPLLFISLALILYLGGGILLYIVAPHDITYYLSSTFDRFLLHMVPLILFLDGLLIFERERR